MKRKIGGRRIRRSGDLTHARAFRLLPRPPRCLPGFSGFQVHLKDAVTVDDFVKMRESRDATLSPPKLLEPSLRANVRAGHLTDPFFDTKLVDAKGVTP